MNTQASAADVSAELGISVGTLWRWRKELTAEESTADAPTYDELDQEVHRLKTENVLKRHRVTSPRTSRPVSGDRDARKDLPGGVHVYGTGRVT